MLASADRVATSASLPFPFTVAAAAAADRMESVPETVLTVRIKFNVTEIHIHIVKGVGVRFENKEGLRTVVVSGKIRIRRNPDFTRNPKSDYRRL